jgi:hypothetical protein
VIKQITQAAKDNSHSQIRELLLRYQESNEDHNSQLLNELEQAGFTFLQAFDSRRSGTQAFLAQLKGTEEQPPMLILAFRGTQTNSIEDIKVDAKVGLKLAPQGGGFTLAFSKPLQAFRKTSRQPLTTIPIPPSTSRAIRSVGPWLWWRPAI